MGDDQSVASGNSFKKDDYVPKQAKKDVKGLSIEDLDAKEWLLKVQRMKPRPMDQNLLNACYFGNATLCKKFLQLGGNPNYMEDRDGWLPIHYAGRWGDIPMLRYLLKYGADLDGKTNSNETALHKAARWDRFEIAIILLELGAAVHVKNGDGNRCWDMTQNEDLKSMMRNYPQWKANKKLQKDSEVAEKKRIEDEGRGKVDSLAMEEKLHNEILFRKSAKSPGKSPTKSDRGSPTKMIDNRPSSKSPSKGDERVDYSRLVMKDGELVEN